MHKRRFVFKALLVLVGILLIGLVFWSIFMRDSKVVGVSQLENPTKEIQDDF